MFTEEIEHGFEELEMAEDELASAEGSLGELEEFTAPCVTEFFTKFNAAQTNLEEALALIPQIKKDVLRLGSSTNNIKVRDHNQPRIFVSTKTGSGKDAVIVQGTFLDATEAEKFLKGALVVHKKFEKPAS